MEKFKRLVKRFRNQIHDDGTEYTVRVYFLEKLTDTRTFTNRRSARAYKKIMKEVQPGNEFKITQRQWENGFIVSEKDVR